jgi:adenylylsulfate kinase
VAETPSPAQRQPSGLGSGSPPARGGLTVWLTGLPSAGKTTLALSVASVLAGQGVRHQVLDGDVMREYLTADLGFSKEDRDRNVRRVGYVASVLSYHGVVVLCPLISPYRAAREEVRALHLPGRFLEVHVATPVEVCEERDVKGLYARARRGEVRAMTGIDDPYEPPLAPELVVPAGTLGVEESTQMIVSAIRDRLTSCHTNRAAAHDRLGDKGPAGKRGS